MITFSPYNPDTRKLHSHINRAFKAYVELTKSEWTSGIIERDGVYYTIYNREKLRAAFRSLDSVKVNISFQEHTLSNYAIIG